jgi:hypothetical protein
MRIEDRLRIEFHDLADEATIGVVGVRLDRREHPAEKLGQRVRLEGDAGDDAEPAAAAFERPEEVRIRACVGDFDVAVRGHDLRFDQARRSEAIALGVTAEAAAKDKAGNSHRHAAAPLHVAPAFGGHLIVRLGPDRAGLDRNSRLRLGASFAARAEEGVVHHDRVHVTRPDQEGVGGVRRSLVAVGAALRHDPEIVLAGEIDRRDDVGRRLGGDGVDAWL